ncbi:hypothetical protein B4U79_18982, partial [Dinothrombium tinctorium]
MQPFAVKRPLFGRIVSSVCWHPFDARTLLVASRGGDFKLIKLSSFANDHTVDFEEFSSFYGKGRGSAITGIKWDRTDANWFYTSSVDGMILKRSCDCSQMFLLKDSSNELINVRLQLNNGEFVLQT